MLLGVGLLACVPGEAAAQADPGETTRATIVSDGSEYRYIRYTPATYRADRPAPLMVVVHGCQTTAEQEMEMTLYNRLAEREGFVVLYPDVDAVGRAQPGPARDCWKFPYPPVYFRGHSDTKAIADMTQAVKAARSIDSERVYVLGVSAGGLMAAVHAAAYTDVFAAAGLVVSAGYADGPCFPTGVGIPVAASAELAFTAMESRRRVVPRLVIGSTGDLAFPASCSNKAMEQGLRTSNLVLSGEQTGPIPLAPASVRRDQVPGGRTSTVASFRDPDGCLIGERWIIDGMPHAWPGGTSDPEYAGGYSDPKAPDGAEISWAFMRRYTKSATAMPCAEAPAPGPAAASSAPRRCAARSLLVRLPRGARRVTATVNGRRAAVRRARGGVRVRVPATTRARTSVVVRARTAAGKRVTRRRTARGCG